jgi:hypothetical protein
MKIFNILFGLSLVALLAAFVYQHREASDVRLAPVIGGVQSVTSIDLKAGFPDFTQVSTDQGQYLIGVLVEIPRQTPVVIRQGRDKRFLCLAPNDSSQDLRTLPCWQVLSRSLKEVSP